MKDATVFDKHNIIIHRPCVLARKCTILCMYVSTFVRRRVNSIFEKRFRCTKCFGAWYCIRRWGRGGNFTSFCGFISGKILERRRKGMRQTVVHGRENETRIRLEYAALRSRNRVAYETADRPLGRCCVRVEGLSGVARMVYKFQCDRYDRHCACVSGHRVVF